MRQNNLNVLATFVVLLLASPLASCLHADVSKEEATMKLQLTSSAFKDGESIPQKYTCDADDVSPALKWSGVPEAAKRLALICDDPDAPSGTWVHWVLYDLPSNVTELPEGIPATEATPQGGRQGANDFGRIGYGGPCPPAGKPHRYFFKLYALDAELNVKPHATKADLEKAMRGHILAEGRLMGSYKRK